ncbi:MAG: methyltransferase [Muribaculaceae bacterium]|nr:methyltransferase [Muribaculaceae bacterium]
MSDNPHRETVFRMKRFEIINRRSAMKPGTDGVLLGAWATAENPVRILDVGTGTGLIALMLAQRYAEALITAVEIDKTAADEAQANFKNSPWSERLFIVPGDFARFVTFSKFDLITSNPPFFTSGRPSPDHARAMARHESSLPFTLLFQQAAKLLSPSGRLAMITPADCEDNLIFEASMQRLYPRRICRVTTVAGKKPMRIMWEFSLTDGPVAQEQLTLRDAQNHFTEEYQQLTKDYYLDF